MAATQLPTAAKYLIAGQTAVTGYDVISQDSNAAGNIQLEDILDSDGAFGARIVYEKRMSRVKLSLQCLATAVPTTTFPEGAMAVSPYSAYFVHSCTVRKTKGVTMCDVDLEKINFA